MDNQDYANASIIRQVASLPKHQRSEAAGNLGWEYDGALSHDNWSVLRHRHMDKTLIAYRPTQWQKPRDLLADMDIVANRLERNTLYKEALESRNKAAAKYGQRPELIGYSLGGSLAIKVGKATGDKVMAYSPGSNPFIREHVPSNVKVVRDSNDPISYGYSNLDNVKHYAGLWKFTEPVSLFSNFWLNHDLPKKKLQRGHGK